MPLKNKPKTDNGLAGNTVKNYYLLVIAIDYYQSGFKILSNAVRDANRITKVLTSDYTFHKPAQADDLRFTDPGDRYADENEAILVYNSAQTTCLYNEQATRTNIIKKIGAIYTSIGEDDALLVYFAGHGVHALNKKYYLITSESKSDDVSSWLRLDDLTSYFDDFAATKKCRDLLLVLDCCYAGSSMLGFNLGEAGDFSRYILTSCKHTQEASDGVIGDGSPFALKFESLLIDNSSPYMYFDQQQFGKLKSRFDRDNENVNQHLSFGFVSGGKTGQGYFLFEKTEKDKPKPKVLKEALIDHLDFTLQRGDMEKEYKLSKNRLNFIITQGYSFNIQKVLSKIIFRWLSEEEWGAIPIQGEVCYVSNPIKIDNASLDLWQTVYNNLKDDLEKLGKDKETVYNYFFEKLFTDERTLYGKRHVIIILESELGGNKNFERVQNFFNDFSAFFLKKYESLSEESKGRMGKMFIVFSDERLNGSDYKKEIFTKITNVDKFNLLPLEPVEQKHINNIHIKKWIKKISDIDSSKKIQQLNDPVIVRKLMKLEEGCVDFTCYYEEFIENLYVYCEYTEEEKMQVSEYLFDFKKSLI